MKKQDAAAFLRNTSGRIRRAFVAETKSRVTLFLRQILRRFAEYIHRKRVFRDFMRVRQLVTCLHLLSHSSARWFTRPYPLAP